LSEIRATTISDAAGTGPITLTGQSAAKAWWNANGTGTIAINDSFNCSSITDNTTGVITGNLTSSMANNVYSLVIGSDTAASNSAWNRVQISDASSGTSRHYENGTLTDTTINIVNCHGDLA